MKQGKGADLGSLLPAVGQAWRRALGQRLSADQLSDATVLPILLLLRAGDKLMRQHELAKHLGLENSAVVRLLDTLEKGGLLRRLEDPLDRRAKLLELTDEGVVLGRRADKVALVLREELLGDIEPDDIATAYRVLLKVFSALDDCQARSKG
ncbi:MarR family winged helix-turn-helix transcriptional regulator [Bosea thiooxidans]|nr:MarR family transcriptional regulator [Bosea sp. (in: a-proteobacteria)]